jgi:hypothetical protein
MFRRKEEPQKDENLSNVTKVILKDLKGGVRVTKHNFHKGDEAAKKEKNNDRFKRGITPWNIGIAGGIILALIVSVSVWKEIFIGKEVKSKREEITYTPHPKFKQVKPKNYPRKTYKNEKKEYAKKSYIPSKKTNPKKPINKQDNRNKIYGWIDEEGKEHYTNLESNVRKKIAHPKKPKKKILGYTITLSSGKKIYCEKLYKIHKDVFRVIAGSIEWQLHTSDIRRIEERSRIGSKDHIKFIGADKI